MASLHWISYTIPADLSGRQSETNSRLSASLAIQLDGIYYRKLKIGCVIETSGEFTYFLDGLRYSDGGASGRMYHPQGKAVKLLVYS